MTCKVVCNTHADHATCRRVREAQLSSAATDGQVESAWATALQDDQFRAVVEEGERDVRTGRLTSWQEVRKRLVTRSS